MGTLAPERCEVCEKRIYGSLISCGNAYRCCKCYLAYGSNKVRKQNQKDTPMLDKQQIDEWVAEAAETAVYYPSPLEMVREFAEAMGQPLDKKVSLSKDTSFICDVDWITEEHLRYELVDEEFYEFKEARFDEGGETPSEEVLKELADLIYVAYGYAAYRGWDLDEAVRRVHQSNMSKLGDDGKPIFREDGKVLKGPNYRPPFLNDLVEHAR